MYSASSGPPSSFASKPAFLARVAARNGFLFPEAVELDNQSGATTEESEEDRIERDDDEIYNLNGPDEIIYEAIADKLSHGASVRKIAAESGLPVLAIEAVIKTIWKKVRAEAIEAGEKTHRFAKLTIKDTQEVLVRELFRHRRLEWKAAEILSNNLTLADDPRPYATKYVRALAPEIKSPSDIAIVLELRLEEVNRILGPTAELARSATELGDRRRPKRGPDRLDGHDHDWHRERDKDKVHDPV